MLTFEEFIPKDLSKKEYDKFKQLLEEYADVFQVQLGCFTLDLIEVEISADVELFFCQPYPIPKLQFDIFK